jgi:hypothetical protein
VKTIKSQLPPFEEGMQGKVSPKHCTDVLTSSLKRAIPDDVRISAPPTGAVRTDTLSPVFASLEAAMAELKCLKI